MSGWLESFKPSELQKGKGPQYGPEMRRRILCGQTNPDFQELLNTKPETLNPTTLARNPPLPNFCKEASSRHRRASTQRPRHFTEAVFWLLPKAVSRVTEIRSVLMSLGSYGLKSLAGRVGICFQGLGPLELKGSPGCTSRRKPSNPFLGFGVRGYNL